LELALEGIRKSLLSTGIPDSQSVLRNVLAILNRMTAQVKGAQACLAGAAGFFQEVVVFRAPLPLIRSPASHNATKSQISKVSGARPRSQCASEKLCH
jgi:hypothetical protein